LLSILGFFEHVAKFYKNSKLQLTTFEELIISKLDLTENLFLNLLKISCHLRSMETLRSFPLIPLFSHSVVKIISLVKFRHFKPKNKDHQKKLKVLYEYQKTFDRICNDYFQRNVYLAF
jgi:hypothetical protein